MFPCKAITLIIVCFGYGYRNIVLIFYGKSQIVSFVSFDVIVHCECHSDFVENTSAGYYF